MICDVRVFFYDEIQEVITTPQTTILFFKLQTQSIIVIKNILKSHFILNCSVKLKLANQINTDVLKNYGQIMGLHEL